MNHSSISAPPSIFFVLFLFSFYSIHTAPPLTRLSDPQLTQAVCPVINLFSYILRFFDSSILLPFFYFFTYHQLRNIPACTVSYRVELIWFINICLSSIPVEWEEEEEEEEKGGEGGDSTQLNRVVHVRYTIEIIHLCNNPGGLHPEVWQEIIYH